MSATEEAFVNFSFDQVDVSSFAKLVGDITGRQFVVDEGAKGKITIVSPRVKREEVYPLFVSILESAGCSVIRDGQVHRIVAMPQRSVPDAPVMAAGEALPEEGVVTKVFRLEHVSAEELRKAFAGRIDGGKGGALVAIEETNHLIVTDTARSIRRMETIIDQVDQPGLARAREVVTLQFASASELAAQLNLALSESASRGDSLKNRLPAARAESAGRGDPIVVAAPESNSLILVGTPSQIEELKRLIGRMDVDTARGRGRLNAIFLKYSSAEEAAKSISTLLARTEAKAGEGGDIRRIAIEASPENNALLVDASPGDFEVVRQLVEQLDQPREQVLIEVLIVEVSGNKSLQFGVDMVSLQMPDEKGSLVAQGASLFSEGADSLMNSIQQGLFPRGITVGAAYGSGVDAEGNVVASYPAMVNIDAFKKNSNFKILSETALETQNNREATVKIVNDIPILKSTIEGGSGTSRDVIQNIERVDVGIKLTLTPHVISSGEVRMELNPTIEAILDPASGGNELTPTIARREVKTTVSVLDGHTIVIAGLTQETTNKVDSGVPFLSAIPILGALFRHTSDSKEKTNLLIFVTPHVVSNPAVAGGHSDRWKAKTGLVPDEDEGTVESSP